VSPPLEAPPLAAALLAAGPRGSLPLYNVPHMEQYIHPLYSNPFHTSDKNLVSDDSNLKEATCETMMNIISLPRFGTAIRICKRNVNIF
jgi:hypothetical protein